MEAGNMTSNELGDQASTTSVQRPAVELQPTGEPSVSAVTASPKLMPDFKAAATIGAVVLSLLCATIAFFAIHEPEKIWAPRTVDMIVLGTIITFLATLAAGLFTARFSTTDPFRPLLRRAVRWLGAIALLLGFFVAYASFRTQSRLAAEETLSTEGYFLSDLEMQKPELRCLYLNYGHEKPQSCLDSLVSTPELWSTAIFYVEDVWYQLAHANDQRNEWGADYAESIRYWADDVSQDPTGLFSYYLVSTEPTLSKAMKAMAAADVSISKPNLCQNYKKVWRALVLRKAQPRRVSGGARECDVRAPLLETIAGE